MVASSRQKLLCIGLGNPGKNYALTRHNLGFMVAEEFAQELGLSWQDDKRFNARVAKGILNDTAVDLLLPLTYMNISGWSVRHYLDYYKLTAHQIVVICDDIALPFGQLRMRCQGSAGGHNGIKSVIAYLGTDEFTRLRMGIGMSVDEKNGGHLQGQPPHKQPLADYVLSNFTAAEAAALDEFVKRGAAVLRSLTIETVTQVMNQINTKLTL